MPVGCGEEGIVSGPWASEIAQAGDTTVVRTLSGSVWERSARLVEEFRLGDLEGDGPTAFGDIAHAAVASDGTLFLFDSQVPQIVRFDPEGGFLGSVGREGQGPGEYSGRPSGMIVSAGRLLLSDPRNARLSAFALDGEYLGTLGPVAGLRSTFVRSLLPGAGGGFAVVILTIEPTPGEELPMPWPVGFEVRGAEGVIQDTIWPQEILGQPGRLAGVHPSGRVLVDSDADFLFELRREGGDILRIEMPFERIRYSERELQAMGPALGAITEADHGESVREVRLKPPYLEYLFSPDGRIWARRPIADPDESATWRVPQYQPSVLDVFGPDGRYFGVVPLPARMRPVAVDEAHLYVVQLGDFDEQYLVKYRVETP